MEDYDWIQVAYIFDKELTVDNYRSLFERLVEYGRDDKELEILPNC